jgi:glycosyltransferase involved in cell wall biosynthesis
MFALSVVIATYNRRDTLKVTLQCLSVQTLPADQFEVIVVDDGSPDDTQAMVESLIAEMPYRLRYYRHANRGPGASENRGIHEATADLVLLIADDIQPTPSMLACHVQAHERRPDGNIAVLGRALQSPRLPETHFQRHWDPFKFQHMRKPMEVPYWKFWACNISIARKFLLENGLFSELKGAAHEDVELGYRLARKGLRILYEPDALAHHYHVETLQSACARAYERGLNWRFVEEHIPDPEIYVRYQVLTSQTLKFHIQALTSRGSTSLPLVDRVFPLLVLKHLVRWAVFNRLTVTGFWLPVLRRAEGNRLCRLFGNVYTYRLVVFYHFYKGCCEQAAGQHRMQRSMAESD